MRTVSSCELGMSDQRNPPVAQEEGSGEPLEFERLVSGFIAHQDRKSSGGGAPEVPEAKDSFIVRERSGNLIQGGFERPRKIDV